MATKIDIEEGISLAEKLSTVRHLPGQLRAQSRLVKTYKINFEITKKRKFDCNSLFIDEFFCHPTRYELVKVKLFESSFFFIKYETIFQKSEYDLHNFRFFNHT